MSPSIKQQGQQHRRYAAFARAVRTIVEIEAISRIGAPSISIREKNEAAWAEVRRWKREEDAWVAGVLAVLDAEGFSGPSGEEG